MHDKRSAYESNEKVALDVENTEQQVEVLLTEAQTVATRILEKSGYVPEEREQILEVLMYAELRGSSQGLLKLLPPGLLRAPTAATIDVEVDRGSMVLLKGNWNPAMVVMCQAADLAVTRAREHGIALVGSFDTALSTGAIGYYSDRIAKSGCIGVVASGTPAFVAPHGSTVPLFGTNPFSIGVPTDGNVVVLDLTTAKIPWYDVLRARSEGRPIAEGAAVDSAGETTTDPHRVRALRAFDGGPRSSGLAFMLEIFTGPLVRAEVNRVGEGKKSWGNLVIAIDPAFFQPFVDFTKATHEFVQSLEGLTPVAGQAQVSAPGHRGQQRASAAKARGTIFMAPIIWERLQLMAR